MRENHKMKNNGLMTIVLVAVALSLGSCQKYLDIKKTGAQKFIETPEDCQRLLDNYSVMNTDYPSDGTVSANEFYFGTNSYPADIVQEDRDIYTWANTAKRRDAGGQWTGPYYKVYTANLVLEALEGMKKSTDVSTWNNLRGSALFYRAYALWNIAQQYAKPYSASSAGTDPGIPARTSPDLAVEVGRGTVKDTYDRIIQDLNEAVGLLNTTSVACSRPNKASAYAMLARVYLSMEDYANAQTSASASLDLNHYLMNYNDVNGGSGPFAELNQEILFQSILSTSNFFDPGSVGEPKARINDELYAAYNNNDLRKNMFFNANVFRVSVPNPAYTPDNGQPERVDISFPDGTYSFIGSYEPNSNGGHTQLFNGLAVDEMYLTLAECYARAGNTAAALTNLNTLLVTRWKTDTFTPVTASSAKEALRKVLDERQKELVLRGQRWTDLRRLNKDSEFKKDQVRELKEFTPIVTGDYPNQTTGRQVTVKQSWTLPANDLKYTLLIPNEVIVNSGMQQNLR